MSAIQFSSAFQACKEHGGDYWHGQTVTQYKDGIIEKREHRMVLLWSKDKQFDRTLYKTFQSQIEIHHFSDKTNTTTNNTTIHCDNICENTTSENATSKNTENTTNTTTTNLNNGFDQATLQKLHDGYMNNLEKVKQHAEQIRTQKKREQQFYEENLTRKKAKSLDHFHSPNHFLTSSKTDKGESKSPIKSDFTSKIDDTVQVVPVVPVEPVDNDSIWCVFTETGSLIHTLDMNPGDTHETLLVSACQKLEEELGHKLNFRAFILYDKNTKEEVNLKDQITSSKKEFILKMVKGDDRNLSVTNVDDENSKDLISLNEEHALSAKKRERDNQDENNESPKTPKII